MQVESAYYLYSATKNNHYLEYGRRFLFMLQNHTRTDCGYASIADVSTGRLDDRMDTFFLSETLKYLFLLFDEVWYIFLALINVVVLINLWS